MREHDAGDHGRRCRRSPSRPNLPSLRSMSCTISAIACSAGSSQPGALEQHLEGAAVALVRELGLEHVEADLARLRRVALARHELEARLGVDEAADQPGRGDAVDVDALRASPTSALADRATPSSPTRASSGRDRSRARPAAPRARRAQPRRASRPLAPKKSIATIWASAPAQARELRCALSARLLRLRREPSASAPASSAMRVVVGVARGSNRARPAGPRARRRSAPRRASPRRRRRRSPARSQWKSSWVSVVRRQGVDRVLDRHRAQRLQPAPDLDAEVGRLGRQLVDQQQPRRAAM